MTENKEIRRGVFFILALLCVVGLFFSIKLLFLHYNVHTDSEFQSPCAISDGFNCETVAESTYSVTLGLPNAVWGIFAYIFMLVIACYGFFKREKKYFAALGGLIFMAVVTSITLALISYCIICSFCLYCSCTYITNFVMLIVFAAEWYRCKFSVKELFFSGVSFIKDFFWLEALFVVMVVFCIMVYPHYWEKSVRLGGNLLQGTTEEGFHWIGNRNGVTVEEFSDYMCPACRKRYFLMRELLSDESSNFKMVHRQYPLDQACNSRIQGRFHDGACELAKATFCAGKQGRFWEASDAIFKFYDENTVRTSVVDVIDMMLSQLDLDKDTFRECLTSEEADQAVKKDIDDATALNIQGTPSFVVNGKVYLGGVPKEILFGKEN